MRYSHYSFDLWGTLIKSNPNFKLEREKYFHTKFNPRNKSIEQIRAIFCEVATMCNMCNETTGLNIDPLERYYMILFKLGVTTNELTTTLLWEVNKYMYTLFLEYPPMVYDADTLDILKSLRESYISVISNTGFVGASAMTEGLKAIGIYDRIDASYFSDQHRISKPSSYFFMAMIESVSKYTTHFHKPLKSIHIGDNPIADIEGATAVGMDAFLINSNHLTIKDIPL